MFSSKCTLPLRFKSTPEASRSPAFNYSQESVFFNIPLNKVAAVPL